MTGVSQKEWDDAKKKIDSGDIQKAAIYNFKAGQNEYNRHYVTTAIFELGKARPHQILERGNEIIGRDQDSPKFTSYPPLKLRTVMRQLKALVRQEYIRNEGYGYYSLTQKGQNDVLIHAQYFGMFSFAAALQGFTPSDNLTKDIQELITRFGIYITHLTLMALQPIDNEKMDSETKYKLMMRWVRNAFDSFNLVHELALLNSIHNKRKQQKEPYSMYNISNNEFNKLLKSFLNSGFLARIDKIRDDYNRGKGTKVGESKAELASAG